MLVDAVIDRLRETRAVDRVDDAIALNALLTRAQLPAAGVSAFVVPGQIRGGSAQTGSGYHTQLVDETVTVFLALRDESGAGSRGKDRLTALLDAVIPSVAGWQAPGAVDTFRLVLGRIVSFEKGVILYQIDFATQTLLRITA